MKVKLILMVLSLGILCISASAQTKKQSTAKLPTKSRSTNSKQGGQIMKFKQVAEDGYVWYKLKRGNLCGARDAEGNNIIPIKYDDVVYICEIKENAHKLNNSSGRQDGVHYFKVSKGHAKGVYTREGYQIISTDKKYKDIFFDIGSLNPCWKVSFDGIRFDGILDMKGNIVIESGKYQYAAAFRGGIGIVDFNNRWGLCDWNGKVVVPCQYEACWRSYEDGEYVITYKENGVYKKKIDGYFNEGSNFDYQTYDNLIYNYDASLTNSSISSVNPPSSSSSTSSGTTNKKNTGNNTTTIHVEHHHDPVPVQQWQACFGCGGMGTMGCDNCGGSGTRYVGDRLYTCSRCNGRGIIPCNVCYGNKGQYITVYK